MFILALLGTTTATGLRQVLRARPDLTTFANLLDQFEAWQLFEGSTTDVTVMAPNDAAYDELLNIGLDLAAMPADFTLPVLRYHLLMDRVESSRVPGETRPILVQSALTGPNMTQPSPVKMFWKSDELYAEGGLQLTTRIVERDVEFSGGIMHVLDASLVAPHNISATVWMNGVGEKFLQFMEETDMVSEIESLHDATLFVPSNEAWQRSESTLAAMNMDEKRALLRNHAVRGRIAYQEELGHGQTLASIGGQSLETSIDEKAGVLVGQAALVQTDLLWYNGVAHIVDRLITPEKVRTRVFEDAAGTQCLSLTVLSR